VGTETFAISVEGGGGEEGGGLEGGVEEDDDDAEDEDLAEDDVELLDFVLVIFDEGVVADVDVLVLRSDAVFDDSATAGSEVEAGSSSSFNVSFFSFVFLSSSSVSVASLTHFFSFSSNDDVCRLLDGELNIGEPSRLSGLGGQVHCLGVLRESVGAVVSVRWRFVNCDLFDEDRRDVRRGIMIHEVVCAIPLC
jgi:hypothetical protein